MKKHYTFLAGSATVLVMGFAMTPAAFANAPVWTAHPPIHMRGNATSTFQNGYQPAQIRTAYGLSQISHTGVVYTASAGDSGSQAQWPAVSPNVLSVGGTSLTTNADGSYQSESAWSSSGGDPSVYESTPTYQSNWTSVVGTQRGVPDVSWDANPNTGVAVYDSTRDQGQKGWFEVGGTSVGAPSWAALIALADQGRSTPLSSSQALTQMYNTARSTGSSGYSTNYHDVTSGSNGNSAQAGYDMVTGIGSPQFNNLVQALISAP